MHPLRVAVTSTLQILEVKTESKVVGRNTLYTFSLKEISFRQFTFTFDNDHVSWIEAVLSEVLIIKDIYFVDLILAPYFYQSVHALFPVP